MHQMATPCEEQQLLRTAASAEDAALLAEAAELRVTNEQLRRAPAGHAVIDQARGMVMALAPCSSDRAWDLLVVDVRRTGGDSVRARRAAVRRIPRRATPPFGGRAVVGPGKGVVRNPDR